MDLVVSWNNYFSANITDKKIPISTFILHLLPNYKGIVFVSLYFFQKTKPIYWHYVINEGQIHNV